MPNEHYACDPNGRSQPLFKLTDRLAYVCDACHRENGDTWSTVGVSGNIIDASFQALVDAITYRLLKVGVDAQ